MAKTSMTRRFKGAGPRPDHTEVKKKEAIERQSYYDTLTPVQKIEALDRKLGKGVGAVKQRARLAKPQAKKPATAGAAQVVSSGTVD